MVIGIEGRTRPRVPSKFHRLWTGLYGASESESTCVVAREDIHNTVRVAVHFNKLKP